MKKFWEDFFILILGAAFVLTGFPAVYAQEKKSDAKAEFTLEEIVITAERRETSLSDTPISVSAMTGDAMDEEHFQGTMDMTMRMPGTSFVDTITIRGIGREMADLGGDVGVGLFFDGAYNEQYAELGTLVDVARVETVRGPQSTLYGRNTVGGAINIIYARPEKGFHGQLKARIGNYQAREFTAVLNHPIVGEWLLGRISFQDRYYGGHVKNLTYNEMAGKNDDWQLRMMLLFDFTDNFESYFQYKITDWYQTHSGQETNIMPYTETDVLETDASKPNALFEVTNPRVGGTDPYVSVVNHYGAFDLTSKEVNNQTTLDVGNLTFKNIAFYRWWFYWDDPDYDGGPSTLFDQRARSNFDTHEWSEEFQVLYGGKDSRINGLLGYYYFSSTKGYYFFVNFMGPGYWEFTYDSPYPGIIPGKSESYIASEHPQNEVYNFNVDIEATSKSVYGNIGFDITDKLNINAGARYAIDEKWTQEWGGIVLHSGTYGYPAFNYTNPAYQTAMGIDPTEAAAEKATLDLSKNTITGRYNNPDDILRAHELGYYFKGWPFWYIMNPGVSTKDSWDAVMWKVGLDFKPRDGQLIYFGINRGYKPGGVSIANNTGVTFSFDPEYLLSYEGGLKSQWFDGRLNTNLSIYFYDFQDKQLSFGVYDEETKQTDSFTTNAADTTNYGCELEASYLITENLLASIQYAYMHTEYATDFLIADPRIQNADGTWGHNRNMKGEELPYSPPHRITLHGRYTYPTDIGDFVLIGTYTWQDEMAVDLFSMYEDNRIKPWDMLNAQVSWNNPDYSWRITIWGNNLLDQPSVTNRGGSWSNTSHKIVALSESVVSPLQFGIEFSYKW